MYDIIIYINISSCIYMCILELQLLWDVMCLCCGVERATSLLLRMTVFSIFIYVCRTFINRRVHRRFYRLSLQMKWLSWKTHLGYARFVTDEENTAADSKTKGMSTGFTCCLVISCRGKVARVLFSLKYSTHQHTSIRM